MPGFVRAASIKALDVTTRRRFYVTRPVDNLLASCARTLIAMRTSRLHGLQTNALHATFPATVVAKLSYAPPAWLGYANADDKARLEAVLRRSSKLGSRADLASTSQASGPRLTTSYLGTFYIMSYTYFTLFCLLLVTIITTSEVRRTIISSSN